MKMQSKSIFSKLIEGMLILALLVGFTVLSSQDLLYPDPVLFKENKEMLRWEPSGTFEDNNPENLKLIAIPFQFPAKDIHHLGAEDAKKPIQNLGFHGFTSPGVMIFHPNQSQKHMTGIAYTYHSYNPILQTPNKEFQNKVSYLVSTNISPFANTNSGLVFMYMKKNLGLNFDMTMRLSGGLGGSSSLETVATGLTLSYRLAGAAFKNLENSGLNFILQVTGVKNYFEIPSLKEPKDRSFSFNPGFSFGFRSVLLEGTVQLPVHTTSRLDNVDVLWKYEYQGRLGAKWFLPDSIR